MLIALNQIVLSGGTRRVLVNPSSIYVANEDGTGSIVSMMTGTIRVKETPEQIKNLVSSATPQNESNI
jgi:hypothetical protein